MKRVLLSEVDTSTFAHALWLFVVELTLITSSLASLGGGEGHLHLLEAPAAPV